MLGSLLALGSAALFGLNSAATRRGVLSGSVLQGMAITVPMGVPILLIATLMFGGFSAMAGWVPTTWGWMIAAGILHFVIGRYGAYRATQSMGAALSTPIQQSSTLVALGLGFTFLGETITPVNALGIALILLGPMMLIGRRKAVQVSGKKKGFQPDYGPGIFWGFVGAVSHGTSPLLIAIGLGEAATIADGVAGGLVSYIAASFVMIVLVFAIGGRRYMRSLDRASGKWFALAGLTVGLSQVLRYMALAVAPISVVIPIQRLSAVFRLLFGAAINKDHEVFDRWVVVSIFLAIAGAVALAINTGTLLAILGLSHATWLSQPLF